MVDNLRNSNETYIANLNAPIDTIARSDIEVKDFFCLEDSRNMLQHLSSFGFSQESDEDYISRVIDGWDRDTGQVEAYVLDEDETTTDTASLLDLSTSPPRRSQRLKDRKSNAKSVTPHPQLQ